MLALRSWRASSLHRYGSGWQFISARTLLDAKREFILWWDAQDKDKGGHPSQPVTPALRVQDLGLGKADAARQILH
jgi:hypothetical protein